MGFFEVLENLMSIEIPNYLKNILTLYGLDNAPSMRNINDDLIKEIQKFVVEDMLCLIPTEKNLKDYFGNYANNIEKFKFVGGHILLMKELVIFINDTLSRSPTLQDGFLVFKVPSAPKEVNLKSSLTKKTKSFNNNNKSNESSNSSNSSNSNQVLDKTTEVETEIDTRIDINKFTDSLYSRIKSFLTVKKLNKVNYYETT